METTSYCDDPLMDLALESLASEQPPARSRRRTITCSVPEGKPVNPASRHPSSSLFEKIGYLQAVAVQLVSRPDDSSSQQQLREIETLLDGVMEGTEGILQHKGGEFTNNEPKLLAAAGCGGELPKNSEVLHCSSLFGSGKSQSSSSSGSSKSSASTLVEKFGLDIVFDALERDRSDPQQQQLDVTAPKLEDDNDAAEEFMAYLVNEDDEEEAAVAANAAANFIVPDGRKEEPEDEPEALPPGSYDLIELDAMEILAEHTHFCDLCGKGFKRDANLRMHMRGHGDEYKTAAALSKPKHLIQEQLLQARRTKRYSCPFEGCKRHKLHPKFSPLKTVLCVKNHYRRSHCPKMLTCSKCRGKKFSVVADLRTHEKHCGREKWMCSCGTSFSRKDKLLGHVSLFVGHAPSGKNAIFPAAGEGFPPQLSEEQGFSSEKWSAVVFAQEFRG